jgi:uncharacterized RmlC-like cupin family protein
MTETAWGRRIVRAAARTAAAPLTGSESAQQVHTVVFPPGKRDRARRCEHHESAIYVLQGECELWSGDRLGQHDLISAGDVVLLAPGVPRLLANRSVTAPLSIAVAVHSSERDCVVLMPELDQLVL